MAAKSPWNDETWFTHNTVSSRAWNGTVGVRQIAGRASKPMGDVSGRLVGAGMLAVTVWSEGPWQAALIAADGSVVASQAGQGSSQFRLDGSTLTTLLTK